MAYNILQSVIENYPEVAEYIFGETELKILDETGIPSDTQREVVIRGSYKRGALQGIIISGLILCLYVFMKRTVRKKEQLNKHINLHDLGSLPHVKMKKRRKEEFNNLTILNKRISLAYEEAIRRLRIRCVDIQILPVLVTITQKRIEGKFLLLRRVEIFAAVQGYHRTV